MTDKPWLDEPNELDWVDEKTKYPCHIMRHSSSGHLCGYVSVPPAHPFFGKGYSAEAPRDLFEAALRGPIGKRGSISLFTASIERPRIDLLFDVHGSLTFAGPRKGREGWWFGFDCAHAGDLSPFRRFPIESEVYRDIAYVRAECASLADQLSKVAT